MPKVLPFPPPAIVSILSCNPYYLSKALNSLSLTPSFRALTPAAIATEAAAPPPNAFPPRYIMADTLAPLSMVSAPVSMARRGALWVPGGTMVAV